MRELNGPHRDLSAAVTDRGFFARPALDLAPELLGLLVVRASAEGLVAVRLTEVEAYEGADDPGSHGYRGPTARTAVMFGPPGHLYVYFTYGMHWCANVVSGNDGHASAVLLRAGAVERGHELARSRRPAARGDHELACGPARLATVLGLTGADGGADLCSPDKGMWLARPRTEASGAASGNTSSDNAEVVGSRIRTGPRVGLSKAADRPWRFWLDEEPSVSPYRAHSPRRRGR